MQSIAINPNDSKVSEKAKNIYAFVNGHTNSNGREMKACKTTLSI